MVAETALRISDVQGLQGVQSPRIATLRDPRLPSGGPALVELAAEVGVDVDPWQGTTLDVALEYDPVTGLWTKPTVLVVVARQNGKTVLIQLRVLGQLFLFDELYRGRFSPQTVLHTAQDRTVARETFLGVCDLIDGSRALRRLALPPRMTNGQEELTLHNGSSYRILAPRQSAFRYWSSNLVIVDEVREHRNADVWSAAQYTQQAMPDGQTWATSNAGDVDSVVLNRLQDRGRAAAAGNGDNTIALLEWSAPDDALSDDVRAWAAANPALGRRITGEKVLEGRINDEEHRFRTEALCIRQTGGGAAAIPADRWRLCAERELQELRPGDVRPVLAVDLDPERQSAAIVAVAQVELAGRTRLACGLIEAWSDPDGVVDEATVAASVEAWARAFRPRAVAYDPFTTSGVVARIKRLPPDVLQPVTGVNWYTASGQLWAAVVGGGLAYSPADAELSRQVLLAARADVGDGAWRIARKDSASPIPAATALARAVHLWAQAHPAAGFFTSADDEIE